MKLAAGTRLVMEAMHDNSADNPRNPSQPPQRVTFGEQTTNEMSAALLQLVPVNEAEFPSFARTAAGRILAGITAPTSAQEPSASNKSPTGKNPAVDGTEAAQESLCKHDRDADGKLSLEEMVAASGKDRDTVRRETAKFDTDGDGALNLAELTAALKSLGKP